MASRETQRQTADRPKQGARVRVVAVLLVPLLLVSGCGGGDSTPLSAPPSSSDSSSPERYTVSGTIQVTAGTAVDSDVNDPFAPSAPNDTPDTAQAIPNPVSLGGYVNTPGAGNEGRSFSIGDESDFFRIDMTAGQTATLSIARFAEQLDLYVYDGAGGIVRAGGSPGQRSYTVGESGTYVLEVRAVQGVTGAASNYVLSVGQAAPTSQAREPGLGDDFVPGELIVKWREDGSAARGVNGVDRAAALYLEAAGGGPGRERLLRLGETREQIEATFRALRIDAPEPAESETLKGLPAEQQRKWQTLRVLAALREREDVVYAEPNYLRRPFLTPSDPFYALQWHYPQIGLPQGWDLSTGDDSVIVAVVDSGLLLAHPDLQGQLVPGYDFVDGDSRPNDPGDQFVFSSYHGTHVAGTVAAASNNGTGVAGTGWGLKIMPVRALTSTGGTEYDILQSVRFAAGLPNDSLTAPAQPADVINLSLGGEGFSQAAQDLFSQVRGSGIIVVAAAGNTGTRATIYPAAYTGVVAVSAVDLSKSIASYSSFGASIDVAAPGGDLSRDGNGDGYPDGVLSTWVDDSSVSQRASYAFSAGTSMAAPHVAGIAALMRSIDPDLTPQRFDDLLASGQLTRDLGEIGWDERYGHGLIDAFKALSAVGAPASTTPSLAAAPSALNLGTATPSAQLNLRNAGGGELGVDAVRELPESEWLDLDATQADGETGLGSYIVNVDRSGLPEGTYSATIAFDWSGSSDLGNTSGVLEVPVIMQVGSNVRLDDGGTHYVLLLDEETTEPILEDRVTVNEGHYKYRFEGVAPGNYLIVAGSDPNNDNLICDAGEACGAYLTLDQLQRVVVDGNRSDLNFVTSFEARVDAAGEGAKALGRGFVPFEPLTPTPLP